MNEVFAEVDKNRLVIKYGDLTLEDYMIFAEDILAEAKKLKHDFTVFSDLRNFRMKHSSDIVHVNVSFITCVQRRLKEMGASEVIRVVDPQVWLFVAMQESEKEAGYHAIIFDDFEEAENALKDIESELEEKNGENLN